MLLIVYKGFGSSFETMHLYTTNNKVVTVDSMDYTKNMNKIPYEEYGDMIYSGELTVLRVNYENGYTIVSDSEGQLWKVTCNMTDYSANIRIGGAFAVLTKVNE